MSDAVTLPGGDLAALRDGGFTERPGSVDPVVVAAARAAIVADIAERYDPRRLGEYNARSWCPDLRSAPAIDALFDPLHEWVDTLYGVGNWVREPGQIAIRSAGEVTRHVDPAAHIDGNWEFGAPATAESHMHHGILGVFLTDVLTPYAGNLTAWPGSHSRISGHFRNVGPAGLASGLPPFADLVETAPVQLLTRAGDAVLMHGLLAHAAGRNASAQDRVAVFFRLNGAGPWATRSLYRQLSQPPFL